MTAKIEGNKLTFDDDDEVYEINTKKCDVSTYIDENGKQQVFFPLKEREIKQRKSRKRVYKSRKTDDMKVFQHIEGDFENMDTMTIKQLAGLNDRYIEVKENIKKWSLKHPHSRFCYFKLQKEAENDYNDDMGSYSGLKEVIESKKGNLCGLIDRKIKKLQKIYALKLKEDEAIRISKIEELLRRKREKTECDCGGKYVSSCIQAHYQHKLTNRHKRWVETYTQANNQPPPEKQFIPINTLRQNTDAYENEEIENERIEEIIETINEEEIIDMPDEEFNDMIKVVDDLKKVVEEADDEDNKYHCPCGMTILTVNREKHFNSAEHFANISESEDDEEPTENIIISFNEPIACC